LLDPLAPFPFPFPFRLVSCKEWESDRTGESEYELCRRMGLHDFDARRSVDPPLFAAQKLESGVVLPGVSGWLFARDREEEEVGTACFAAWMRRFVVPRVFVDPLRAEQTITSLWSSRYLL
jgi:hypothetical protein